MSKSNAATLSPFAQGRRLDNSDRPSNCREKNSLQGGARLRIDCQSPRLGWPLRGRTQQQLHADFVNSLGRR